MYLSIEYSRDKGEYFSVVTTEKVQRVARTLLAKAIRTDVKNVLIDHGSKYEITDIRMEFFLHAKSKLHRVVVFYNDKFLWLTMND